MSGERLTPRPRVRTNEILRRRVARLNEEAKWDQDRIRELEQRLEAMRRSPWVFLPHYTLDDLNAGVRP